jgi:23S rRNA (adenine2503-C2)-methyltransferase
MISFLGLSRQQAEEAVVSLGLKRYRGKQILEWIYNKGAASFIEMTNISQKERAFLQEQAQIGWPELVAQQADAAGKTRKYLLGFADGIRVETVLMHHPYGYSLCVSSQAGCAMGCVFCASTLHGLERNLTAAEMLAQVLFAQRELNRLQAGRLHSFVIMGSGEPLHNYEEVLRFIKLCHDQEVLGLGYRHMTLSTCGIVPAMERLRQEGLPLTLSISLHASNDELRSRIMPVNRTYPLQSLLTAADAYAEATGRRITYEYTLMKDWNDSQQQAEELAALLRGRLCHVNLIPVNAVAERGIARPSPQRVESFAQVLQTRGIAVTVRRERGVDIQAACGQLRNRNRNESAKEEET